ncbi:MAG: SMC-Scp complex subunit ScpB [Candidatus Heimdallarchaeota archaeon]
MDVNQLTERNVIEATLYLLDRPVAYSELAEIIQIEESAVEKYIEELRDEYLDRKTAYTIVDTERGNIQLKLREEVAAHLPYPFVKRSEVPQHLLKILSIIAFKEYVLGEQVTPTKLQRIFGKKKVREDIDELSAMALITITLKGNKRVITVTEEFLDLFKLPKERRETKEAIQDGLRNYALKQLQYE